jgi:hypothetical protein
MNPDKPLSPKKAVIVGVLVIACGIGPILGALELIPYPLTPGTPVWVGVSAGMLFVLAGVAVINGYGSTGVRHPFVQNVLGLSICVLFAAVFGWVALGPGERNFSSTVELPFWRSSGRGSEWIGRTMFGIGALMAVAIAVVAAIAAVRTRR